MAYLYWSSDLDTGIAEIDAQHRHIVDYINQLASSQGNGDLRAVDRVLDELIDYTLLHFGFEEELQIRANYAFYNAHKRAHEKFTRQIHAFKLRSAQGEHVGHEVLAMLKKWLVHHIKGEDADYVAAVKRTLDLQASPAATSGGWLQDTLDKLRRRT